MLPTNCTSRGRLICRLNWRIPFDVLLISNRCLWMSISLCFMLSLVLVFTLKFSAPFICTFPCFEFRFFYNLYFLSFPFFLFLCSGLCLFITFRLSLFDTPSLSFSFILLLFCIFSLTHFPWSPLLSISHTISLSLQLLFTTPFRCLYYPNYPFSLALLGTNETAVSSTRHVRQACLLFYAQFFVFHR